MFKETSKLKESIDLVVAADSYSETLVCSENQVEDSPVTTPASPPLTASASVSNPSAPRRVVVGCGMPFMYGPRQADISEPKRPFWHATGQRVAITSMVLASMMSYFMLHLLSGHFFWHFSGVQTTAYMHSTIDASTIGVVVTMFCYAEFLYSFLRFKHTSISVFIGCLVASLVTLTGFANGGVGGAITALICCTLCLAVGKLASLARMAIPPTFRAGRAVLVAAAASIPATLVTLTAFYQVFTHPRPANYYSVYGDSSCGDEITAAVALFFFLAIPAYAFVRCARTSEAKPLVALGLLQMSPLVAGFLAQLALLAPRGDGLAMTASGLITLSIACALVATGSALGALVNGAKHRRKMAKAGI